MTHVIIGDTADCCGNTMLQGGVGYRRAQNDALPQVIFRPTLV